LHINAAIFFHHAPPGFHSPEVTAILIWGFFMFAGLAGVFDFRNARSAAAAVRPRGRVAKIADIVFGVEDHGKHFFAVKTKEHLEVVAIARLDPGAFYVGRVVPRVLVVVLQDAKHVL